MAARLRKRHDEQTRHKIQASQLINRLTNHALGEVEMSSTQVKAADILLKKRLPDLSAVEMVAEVDFTVASAEPMSPEEWQQESVGPHSPDHKPD